MPPHGIAMAVGAASIAGLVAVDVLSKSHGRAHAPVVGDDDAVDSPGPRWVHHEHPGPRPLGIAVAAVPAAIGAAGALAITRFGGSTTLAAAGALSLATGSILNGSELLARGSNTNPWSAFGVHFNAADVGVVAGAGLLAASAVPIVVKALAR